MLRRLVTAALLLSSPQAAFGHEFWIEPAEFMLDPDEQIVASLRVGEHFDGSSYAYLPRSIRRFEIVAGEAAAEVEARTGDRPALTQEPAGEGLNVIVHVTSDHTLTYDDWASFEAFLEHKDALWALEAHDGRGLPRKDVTETYSRYAKSLVGVGEAAGSDRRFGLETEIVALANPYLGATEMPAQVLYRGEPQADVQVEVFDRAPDGTVEISRLRTDEEGIAVVPLTPGHVYMLDHVVVRERADGTTMWESLWANLTFAVPR